MILIIDMGNTTINCGIYDNDKLILKYRTSTIINKTLEEYILIFKSFKKENNLDDAFIEGALMSSVVPPLTSVIKEAIETVFNLKVDCLASGYKTGLPIRIDEPSILGGDMVADSVAAKQKYGPATIIVDLGTANKIMLVDQNGIFVGCSIAPGLTSSIKALVSSTSLLNYINLEAPKNVIGKNTNDSMNSGAIYGTMHSIIGMVNDFEKEIGYPCKHILTGGNSIYLKSLLKDYIYDANLTLDGIYLIYKRNSIK